MSASASLLAQTGTIAGGNTTMESWKNALLVALLVVCLCALHAHAGADWSHGSGKSIHALCRTNKHVLTVLRSHLGQEVGGDG